MSASAAVVTQIAAGNTFVCARTDTGDVYCWGRNANGQLGQGHTNDIGNEPNEMGSNLSAVDLGAGLVASSVKAGV